MDTAAWAQLVLLGLIWGGSFFFARIAVAELHPLSLVLLRVSIAAAALYVYFAATRTDIRPALRVWPVLALLGLINNVIPFSLIFAGQTVVGAGLASILNATTPFWTLLLANALTSDERFSANKLVGIALGIAGTGLMIAPGLTGSLDGPLWPKFALIGASFSYACALMLAKRLTSLPPLLIAAGQLTASTVIMVPLAGLATGYAGMAGASAHVWAAVVALAVVSTAFAYLLYFRLLQSSGATNASLVTLLVPVSALVLGMLFLGERLETFEVIGMVVILAGLVVIDGRALAALRRNRA